MPRHHPCDVCGHDRQRWQRLCSVCWRQLPGPIRTRITGTFERGDKRAWRAAKRDALDLLAGRVVRHMARHDAAAVYAATAARMGEHDIGAAE